MSWGLDNRGHSSAAGTRTITCHVLQYRSFKKHSKPFPICKILHRDVRDQRLLNRIFNDHFMLVL